MSKNRLNQGDEVLYFDGQTILEKTSVISVEGKVAKLANQVLVSTKSNSEGFWERSDHKYLGSKILPLTEENLQIFEARLFQKQAESILSKVHEKIKSISYFENYEELIHIRKLINKILK